MDAQYLSILEGTIINLGNGLWEFMLNFTRLTQTGTLDLEFNVTITAAHMTTFKFGVNITIHDQVVEFDADKMVSTVTLYSGDNVPGSDDYFENVHLDFYWGTNVTFRFTLKADDSYTALGFNIDNTTVSYPLLNISIGG